MTSPPVIAIVDDDISVRDAMGRLVRSFGLAVELYGAAADLLQSSTLNQIACVITDVQMPRMNGFALCEALRERGCHVPIIFMTAFSEQGHEQRAYAAGAACFVNKPFEDTEIIRCIERALSGGKPNC
ncbi:response regulator [Cupriavidus gilardii]|uniref:response regulator n=1 Tax=Cupriavidus gilardii TaxID=82541 RepID=UPI000AC736A0|nr:response regulator [Cupriavidus gilardii]